MPLDNLNEALEKIRQYFGFLFVKPVRVLYSDFPNAFDNFVVVLETPDFRVRFIRERGSFAINVGTLQATAGWSGEFWDGLITIIMFITDQQLLITGDWENEFNADEQLEHLAKVFHHYYGEIINLYKPEVYQDKKTDLGVVHKEVISLLVERKRSKEKQKLEEKAKSFWSSS